MENMEFLTSLKLEHCAENDSKLQRKLPSVVDEAIVFATRAHRGMVRKGTSTPYILHPLEAASIVATMTDNKDIIAAAVLHDVVEDTDITLEQLEKKFGHIADLVAEESENKREQQPAEETWKIRKQETIEHFKMKASKEAKMIALGDKLSNIRAIYMDYQTLGDSLWERFNQKDKSEHGWYYKAMRDVLSELKDYPAWQEYSKLVDLVFGTNEI